MGRGVGRGGGGGGGGWLGAKFWVMICLGQAKTFFSVCAYVRACGRACVHVCVRVCVRMLTIVSADKIFIVIIKTANR